MLEPQKPFSFISPVEREIQASKYYLMAICAYVLVGFLPIFWDLLRDTKSYMILMHRCVWTFVFLLPVVLLTCPFKGLVESLRRDFFYLLLSSCFIGINWFTYIYAVNHQNVIEASLAYFIAPLITVFLSSVFLKEKTSSLQKIAVILACASILFLIVAKHVFPKFGLMIGGSFSLYGLMGRKIRSNVISRICTETFLLTVLFFLVFQSPIAFVQDFVHFDFSKIILLLCSGVLTITPFFLLNTSIKHLPYSTVGILGFIIPTLIFLVGVVYFHEKMDRDKLHTILFIFLSVGFYIFGSFRKDKSFS